MKYACMAKVLEEDLEEGGIILITHIRTLEASNEAEARKKMLDEITEFYRTAPVKYEIEKLICRKV